MSQKHICPRKWWWTEQGNNVGEYPLLHIRSSSRPWSSLLQFPFSRDCDCGGSTKRIYTSASISQFNRELNRSDQLKSPDVHLLTRNAFIHRLQNNYCENLPIEWWFCRIAQPGGCENRTQNTERKKTHFLIFFSIFFYFLFHFIYFVTLFIWLETYRFINIKYSLNNTIFTSSSSTRKNVEKRRLFNIHQIFIIHYHNNTYKIVVKSRDLKISRWR